MLPSKRNKEMRGQGRASTEKRLIWEHNQQFWGAGVPRGAG